MHVALKRFRDRANCALNGVWIRRQLLNSSEVRVNFVPANS